MGLVRFANAFCAALLLTLAAPASAWNRSPATQFAALPPGTAHPEGITADAHGNLYVANFDVSGNTSVGTIVVFDRNGRLLRTLQIDNGSPLLLGIGFNPVTHDLLVCDLAKQQVLKVDPQTGESSQFAAIPGGTAGGPNGLAFDAAGNVYISDSFQATIWRTSPAGGVPAAWVSDPLLGTSGVPPFGANGIAFNRNASAMLVANTGNDTVVRIPLPAGPSGAPGTPEVFVQFDQRRRRPRHRRCGQRVGRGQSGRRDRRARPERPSHCQARRFRRHRSPGRSGRAAVSGEPRTGGQLHLRDQPGARPAQLRPAADGRFAMDGRGHATHDRAYQCASAAGARPVTSAAHSAALARLLAHPAIWRGGDCASGAGQHRIRLCRARRSTSGRRVAARRADRIAARARRHRRIAAHAAGARAVAGRRAQRRLGCTAASPYAPALAAAGLDLARLVVVRGCSAAEALWAYEQALRAPECGAAFGWMQCARGSRTAPAAGGRARRPHVGRAVAQARPARERHGGAAAAGVVAAACEARRAGAETARRRAFATDRARSRARARRAALSAARRHAGGCSEPPLRTAGPPSRVARFHTGRRREFSSGGRLPAPIALDAVGLPTAAVASARCLRARAAPDDAQRPFVVASGGHYPRVVAANACARAAGIRCDQLISAALAFAPEVVLRDRDPDAEAAALAEVATLAARVHAAGEPRAIRTPSSPRSKAACGCSAVLRHCSTALVQSVRVPRLRRADGAGTYADRRAAARPRRACASPCSTATRWPQRSRRCRSRLLDFEAGTLATLKAAGVTTFGAAQALPRAGLARRFDQRVVDTLDRALGRAPDPRQPYAAAAAFRAQARAARTRRQRRGARLRRQSAGERARRLAAGARARRRAHVARAGPRALRARARNAAVDRDVQARRAGARDRRICMRYCASDLRASRCLRRSKRSC